MSINLGQTIATTLKNRAKETVDNISNHNKILAELRKRGRWTAADGGSTLVSPIDAVENGTGKFYSGGQDSWSIPTEEVIDASEFDWKFYGIFTYVTEAERVKNRGDHAGVRLQKAKIENMRRTMANDIATSIYSDGTGSGGQELGGVQLLVQDDPTASSTVGGIAQNTYAFWRNYTSGSLTLTKSNIKSAMNAAWLGIIRGKDVPHLVMADSTLFTAYWDSLSDLQRFTKTSGGNVMDAQELMYQSARVCYDDQCPAKRMYFLNLDHLEFRYAPGRLFDVEDARKVTNANYTVIPAFFAGNITTSRRASQGVVIDD